MSTTAAPQTVPGDWDWTLALSDDDAAQLDRSVDSARTYESA